MNLSRSIPAPALQRRENEIGLLLDHVGSALLDRIECTLRRGDDDATGAGARDIGDCFDHA